MTAAPLISLSGVSKRYVLGGETICALDTVNFRVERGEFVAIVGPSGSGKSTCMHIIGLLDKPDKGSYLLDGQEVTRLRDKQLAYLRNHKVGFVFQNFSLLSNRGALENVWLPLLYRGLSKQSAKVIAREYLGRLGLKGREQHLPSQLSGGQQQRVAIARALAGSPEIILADEPTGALDSRNSIEIMEVFERLNKEGQTVVLITHNPELAKRAGRVVSIIDGKLTERGV